MQSKGTWLLIGAVLLSVGYAVYDVQSEKKTEKLKTEQSHLLKLDKEQISEIEFQNVHSEHFLIERTAEGWKFKSPLDEIADPNSTQDYVDGVALEQSKEMVKEGTGIDWKVFGLDAPIGTLGFKDNSGKVLKIDVSSKKNFAGDCYVRVQGEEKVYLASSTWITKVEKRQFEYRDKRILKKAAAGIHNFKVSHGKDSFVLTKKDDFWVSPAQPKWKIDQTRSSELIYLLNTVKAVEFTREGAVTAAELKEFGLNHPEVSIEVELKDKQSWKALFAVNSKKDNYVQTFEPLRVLKISPQDMDKFTKMNLESFRDKHEPFDFDKTNVKKIHVTNADLKVDFSLKNDDWVIENEDKNLQYQQDRPKAILSLVRNLEVADFNPPKEGSPDLKDSKHLGQAVQFLDAQGKLIYEVNLLNTYKKNIDSMNKSLIMVKSSAFPAVVGVDEGTLRSIGLENVVKKKVEKSGEKEGLQ